jgi:outer membrane protein TolC
MLQKTYATNLLSRGLGVGLLLTLGGCASTQTRRYDGLASELRRAAPPPGSASERLEVDRISRLDRAAFVRAVLERNPNLESARQAWRAALAEHSQESALDDPMLEYSFAPLSIASSDVRFGQVITISQKLPWPGKRALAGEVALAEAEAARDDYQATRLHLALMASLLFDQYYAVDRSLELNEEHRVLVEDIMRAAEAQYETGRGSQQEPLQAEIELAHVMHQRIVLGSRRGIIVAQMNGLLHRRPESPLPPPPEELALPDVNLGSSAELQDEALSQRPELHARRSELRGGEAARDLADRASYPDFGIMASYNSMWAMPEHQWMLGVSLNIPIQLGKRRGAVEEAEARIAQVRAQILGASDEIRVEVEKARQRLIEAEHVVRLYRERLLPAARAQIDVARSGYVTGRSGFQALIDAERSLRTVELNYQEALATLGERRAELVRTVGRIPGQSPERRTP